MICLSNAADEMPRLRASFCNPVRSARLRKKFVRISDSISSPVVRISMPLPMGPISYFFWTGKRPRRAPLVYFRLPFASILRIVAAYVGVCTYAPSSHG
jgi:hypothetical protein